MKLIFIVVCIALAAVAVLDVLGKKKRKATGEVSARKPLTAREQGMYFRLRDTFPEHVVLAQVAFSGLVTTKDQATRATFDRKVADFVLCTKAFEIVAVIELDDASHAGREALDAKRAAILERAGHRVHRFKNVPDSDRLRAEITAPPPVR